MNDLSQDVSERPGVKFGLIAGVVTLYDEGTTDEGHSSIG